MSWDPRAERITARAEAVRAQAEAERIRAEADIARRRANAELDREQVADRRVRAAERRQAVGQVVRKRGGLLLPVLAIGSPALIAWRGQYGFATAQMHLGVMAPLLPIAIEGSVLYAAYLAHQAVAEELPAGRYRALTWSLAGVAAGMNYWHGSADDIQVGVALAITSLLSIVLLELTIALRKAREGKARTGRGAEQIRRALIRRVRYPRLSIAAAALAAARGIESEQAWAAAWTDRYGIGPDSTRRERRTARTALNHRARALRKAARAGDLTVSGGVLTPAETDGGAGERPDVSADEGSSGPGALADVREIAIRAWAKDGTADLEEWLSAQCHPGTGTVRELPGERSPDNQDSGGERSPESTAERRVSAQDERSPGQPGKRSVRRPRRPKAGSRERLEAVRQLLAERPDLTGADIAAALKIPTSTARRLRARVLDERGDR